MKTSMGGVASSEPAARAADPAPCPFAGLRPAPGGVGHSGMDLRRAGVGAVRAGVGVLSRAVTAGSVGLALTELEAKLHAFELFRWAERAAGAGGEDGGDLEAAVRGALRLEPWRAVWVLEGLGYARGAAAARPGAGPGEGVHPRWWIPLHTGTGMALAEHTLAGLGGGREEAVIRRRVAALAELCAELSAPGYALATFEPFGFMARMLEPRLVRPVAAALGGLDPELSAAFWHGVGRGCYFAPPAFSGARGLEAAWRAAPGSAEALETVAGAAWALTLVNLPRPAVVEAGLAAAHGNLPPETLPAVADGVASAVRLWHHGRGFDPVLAAFLDHRPAAPAAWQGLAALPCRRALRAAGAPGSGHPGKLFRHHPGGPP